MHTKFVHQLRYLALFCLLLAARDTFVRADEAVADDNPLRNYTIPKAEHALFFETFESGWESTWIPSSKEKFSKGKWVVGQASQPYHIPHEEGLLVKGASTHHAISALFDEPLDLSKHDIVIQYEVRLHKDHTCGGAYVKLLDTRNGFKQASFGDDTPYIIMFGPDKCGGTNKVHFIFRHRNPLNGEYEEKHLENPPTMINDRDTHLYTLIVRRDNTYEILVDNQSKKKGSLLTDFNPPVNPPKEIDDPSAERPKDWDSRPKIADPEAKKPDDWDETESQYVLDASATMPEGWLEDAPQQVPDPDAVKPEDWDDEMDGDWEAPLIDNPACSVGCGPWKRPQIKNPKYKGIWRAPLIDNPNYMGEWKPPQIANPDYFEDLEPHKLTPMGGVGIEILTLSDDIEFDNFYIGTDEADREKWTAATWQVKHDAEVAASRKSGGGGLLDPVFDFFAEHPVVAVAGCVVIGLLVLFGVTQCCVSQVDHDTQNGDSSSDSEEDVPEDNEPVHSTRDVAADDTPKTEPAQKLRKRKSNSRSRKAD